MPFESASRSTGSSAQPLRTRMERMRLQIQWLAIGCMAAVLACTDALAPAGRGLRPPPTISRQMDALNTVAITFSWEPLKRDTMATYPFAEGVLVGASIQNLLIASSDQQASCVHVNDGFDYKGVWTSCTGLNQCAWSASISTRGLTTPVGCPSTPPGPYYSKLPGWSDTLLAGGAGGSSYVVAVRGGGSGDPVNCGASPCHTVSGTQNVTISPLAADLDFKGYYGSQAARTLFVPPFTHVSGYYHITFADSALPRSAHGIAMPFQAISWAWQKTDPMAPADSYWHSTDDHQCPTRVGGPPYTSNTCILDVKESGYLLSTTRVNGVPHTDSVSVDCITEDSVFNKGTVRQEMADRNASGHEC